MRIKKKTHSILEELLSVDTKRANIATIESKAEHVLASVFNFMETIEKDNNLSTEKRDELIKRFILAIRHKDSRKFMRALKNTERDND